MIFSLSLSLIFAVTTAKVSVINVSNLTELENRTESDENKIILGLLLPTFNSDIDIVSQYSSLENVVPAVILAARELEQWDWEILVRLHIIILIPIPPRRSPQPSNVLVGITFALIINRSYTVVTPY